MAPRGQKRNAAEAKKNVAAKKAKADAEDGVMMKIVETIQGSDTLPATCRSMLITGVQGSLGTTSDERHEVQAAIVSMVDEVMNAQDLRLQSLLTSSETDVATAEATRVELASKLAAAEASLADEVKSLDEKTEQNTAAVQKVSDAQTLLGEKKALQETGDKALAELQADKVAIQSAIDNDLKIIREGQADCKTLLVLLEKLNCDESLIKALPATCGRGAPDRGDFDGMVVQQLETSLAQKLAELTKSVDDEEIAAKTRCAAVDEAQTAAQVAADLQGKAAEEQANAEVLKHDATTSLDDAKAALKAHEAVERHAATARHEQQAALESFRQSVKSPFELLRDAKAPSPSVEGGSDKMATDDNGAAPVEVGGA